jgi:hypothetical protein
MVCRLIEMHPARRATVATKNHPKKPTPHPNLMFHYRVFGCLGGVFAGVGVAICCTLFTNCYTPLWSATKVADCSQSVHKLLHTVKKLQFGVPTGSPHFLYM